MLIHTLHSCTTIHLATCCRNVHRALKFVSVDVHNKCFVRMKSKSSGMLYLCNRLTVSLDVHISAKLYSNRHCNVLFIIIFIIFSVLLYQAGICLVCSIGFWKKFFILTQLGGFSKQNRKLGPERKKDLNTNSTITKFYLLYLVILGIHTLSALRHIILVNFLFTDNTLDFQWNSSSVSGKQSSGNLI